MASLKSIRKRISSVKNTQQITKAMKMVAAAKLRRAQEAAQRRAPTREKLDELLQTVAARAGDERASAAGAASGRTRASTSSSSPATAACAAASTPTSSASAEQFLAEQRRRAGAPDRGRQQGLSCYFRRRPVGVAEQHIAAAGRSWPRAGARSSPTRVARDFVAERDRRGVPGLQPVPLRALAGADGRAPAAGRRRRRRTTSGR